MKAIVLSVLLAAVMLEAKPYGYGGFGGLDAIGEGIGTGIGTGVGSGVGGALGLGLAGANALAQGAIGLGLGATGLNRGIGNGLSSGLGAGLGLGGYNGAQSNFGQGGQYGNNRVSAGSSGVGSQGFHKQGASDFHDKGQHHSKVTSINQSEQSDAHDVGGSQALNTGAQAGNAFNNFQKGINDYGSQFAQGGASQQSGVLV